MRPPPEQAKQRPVRLMQKEYFTQLSHPALQVADLMVCAKLHYDMAGLMKKNMALQLFIKHGSVEVPVLRVVAAVFLAK